MVIICKSTKCGTKICQNSTIYLTNEMSSTNLNRICCCCWEQFGLNNKSIMDVSETIEHMMQIYVFPGYKKENEAFPSVVCSNCRRNLYLLNQGKSSSASWGEKISKVIKYRVFF